MKISLVNYQGKLRTLATHLRSGNNIVTDAPIDNEGRGENFSPTDLVATALLSCMFTLMGIAAEKHGIELHAMEGDVQKHMGSSPRRIIGVEIGIEIRGEYTNREKSILENAARTCPVAKSLNPEIEQKITFNYR